MILKNLGQTRYRGESCGSLLSTIRECMSDANWYLGLALNFKIKSKACTWQLKIISNKWCQNISMLEAAKTPESTCPRNYRMMRGLVEPTLCCGRGRNWEGNMWSGYGAAPSCSHAPATNVSLLKGGTRDGQAALTSNGHIHIIGQTDNGFCLPSPSTTHLTLTLSSTAVPFQAGERRTKTDGGIRSWEGRLY